MPKKNNHVHRRELLKLVVVFLTLAIIGNLLAQVLFDYFKPDIITTGLTSAVAIIFCLMLIGERIKEAF